MPGARQDNQRRAGDRRVEILGDRQGARPESPYTNSVGTSMWVRTSRRSSADPRHGPEADRVEPQHAGHRTPPPPPAAAASENIVGTSVPTNSPATGSPAPAPVAGAARRPAGASRPLPWHRPTPVPAISDGRVAAERQSVTVPNDSPPHRPSRPSRSMKPARQSWAQPAVPNASGDRRIGLRPRCVRPSHYRELVAEPVQRRRQSAGRRPHGAGPAAVPRRRVRRRCRARS
jgi:hypothetical protein